MKKANEQNACEAFIEILNRLTGRGYKVLESPDESNRRRPDVDFILASHTPRCRKIAVEHTILESFEGQIGYVNISYDVVRFIDAKCAGKIPSDRYYFLAVPHQLVDYLVKQNRREFVDNMSTWVVNTTQNLHINSSSKFAWRGHKITLMCNGTHAQMNGHVWRAPEQPENHERLKSQRLHRAIISKLLRLFKYKIGGFETALLLEDVAGSLLGSAQGGKAIGLVHRILVRIIVDYIVVFESNRDRMVVGNVWKEKSVWYSNIPCDRKFTF